MANLSKIVGIYKITSPTGKIYIGQSWDIISRFGQHRREKRPILVLNRSILKHGAHSHTFEIVHTLPFDVTQSVLDIYEQIYIDAYKSCGSNLLNMKDAGSTGKMSVDARKRMSIANKGRKPWNIGMKGAYTPTQETRDKIGKGHLGRKNTAETIAKMKDKATGRKHTEESKAKMSEQRKGNPGYRLGQKNSPEHIEKTRLSKIGFKHSEETKKKISENNWMRKQKLERLRIATTSNPFLII